MKEYKEEDYLMVSGIQHFTFCRRQWALIHIEQEWADNLRTYEGELMHQRAHDDSIVEKRNGVIVSRGLPVYSKTMGVSGTCDVVEFIPSNDGVALHGQSKLYLPYPVEYKRGKPKEDESDVLQLVAQALCLEEMLFCNIPAGALFYGEIRRRKEIVFTEELREQVIKIFREMHQYFDARYTPKVKWSKACNACSLKDVCVPMLGKHKSVEDYVRLHIKEVEK